MSKKIFVCTTCGSPRVFADAWAALNTDDVRTYDDLHCDDCEGSCHTQEVTVADDFDVETDTWKEPAPPLDRLKAAYRASTQGRWGTAEERPADGYYIAQVGDCDYVTLDERDMPMGDTCQADSEFIAVAHNLTPKLLTALDLLQQILDLGNGENEQQRYYALCDQARKVLEEPC